MAFKTFRNVYWVQIFPIGSKNLNLSFYCVFNCIINRSVYVFGWIDLGKFFFLFKWQPFLHFINSQKITQNFVFVGYTFYLGVVLLLIIVFSPILTLWSSLYSLFHNFNLRIIFRVWPMQVSQLDTTFIF